MNSIKKVQEQAAIKHDRTLRGVNTSGTFLDFIHFLLDYNIIGYTAAFIIAVSASELLNSIGRAIVKMTMRTLRLKEYMSHLLEKLISFVIVVFLVFIIMYVIIQPIVESRQVQRERKVKEVIKATEEKEIEETVKRVNTPVQNGYDLSL